MSVGPSKASADRRSCAPVELGEASLLLGRGGLFGGHQERLCAMPDRFGQLLIVHLEFPSGPEGPPTRNWEGAADQAPMRRTLCRGISQYSARQPDVRRVARRHVEVRPVVHAEARPLRPFQHECVVPRQATPASRKSARRKERVSSGTSPVRAGFTDPERIMILSALAAPTPCLVEEIGSPRASPPPS